MISILKQMSAVLGLVFTVCYFYQIVYLIVGLVKKPIELIEKKKHRYAVLISARNESAVIGQLIESVKQQKYPSDLIEVFVVADNCTDNTAEIAGKYGAVVYERFNKQYVGKGYALDYLIKNIFNDYGQETFDGYFVFDADNILDENYVAEMNKIFSNGRKIITSYRNSKNYDGNWISAGYALWFLRESKFLNNSRMILNTSCAVSGTGFLVDKSIIIANNGWKHHLLTEDIEFSVDNVIQGEKISYCHKAVLYDEQPTSFVASWHQRLRWSKGFYQVFYNYGFKLAKKAVRDLSFSAYDLFMTIAPGIFLTLFSILVGVGGLLYSFINPSIQPEIIDALFDMIRHSLLYSYGTMFVFGLITTITEWKQIHCKSYKKILYLFTFPIYIFTYVPISVVALFKKIKWVPIQHSVVKTAGDIRTNNN